MKERDYTFTDDEQRHLGGWTVLPYDARIEMMERFFADKEKTEIISMFSSFIDMAHAVIDNCRELAELAAIGEWGVHPHEVEKLNMPTLLGAVNGYKMAHGVDPDRLCHGCAYRKGSVANTCLVTVCDTTYCDENGQTFMCHENLNPLGEPTQKCRGFLKARKAA